MKKIIFLIDAIAVVCFNLVVVYGQPAQTLQSEEQAVEVRQILQQYEMARRGELEQPIKCGFTAMALLQADPSLASQFPALAKAMLQRPTLPLSYVTPSGRFKFHYTLTGVDAVNSTSTIKPPTPDYVYEAGLAAERAYHVLVDSLGFLPHADDNVDGSALDFYFQDDQSYGATFPEFASGQNHGPAYITIENDFKGFFTTGLNALRVTVAHEYFHAVQLNIRNINGDSFFFEMSSTWFEDVAYDYVNDYIAYVLNRRSTPFGFFQTFGSPLNTANGWHEYGACIWLHYLVKKLGPARFRFRNNVVYDFWQRSTLEPALASMKTILEASAYSLPFSEALREFGEWCFFTGARADTVQYFEEAKLYPPIDFGTLADGRPKAFRVSQDTVIAASLSPMAIHVYRAARLGQDVRFFLQPAVTSSEAALWKITTISGDRTRGYSKQSGAGFASLEVEAPAGEDTVVFMVVHANPSSAAQTANYQLQISRVGQQELVNALEAPYPNPFRYNSGGVLVVPFRIRERAKVEAVLLREDGRMIWKMNLGTLPAGLQRVIWNGLDQSGERVASGVYFFRLLVEGFHATTKFVVIN
jgi:hypothetical protein